MNNNSFYLKLIRIRGLFLFIFFFILTNFLPLFIYLIFDYFNLQYKLFNESIIENNQFIIISILKYLSFFILFFFICIKKKIIRMFNNESWFISMGKAFFPAIISFSFGIILITFLNIVVVELFKEGSLIYRAIKLPNSTLIDFIGEIKNANYIKSLLFFIMIIIFAPLYEEVLFRGFLQHTVERYITKYNLDIIITALVFSLFHLPSLSNVIFAFFVGLVLSWLRKKKKTINVAIWVHSMVNLSGIIYAIIYEYISNS